MKISQREAILQVTERCGTRSTRRGPQAELSRRISRVNFAWLNAFTPLAPTIKHRAFREKRKWRLISMPMSPEDTSWQVRAGRSMLIPYIPITLAPTGAYLPIQEVVVGPTPHMKLALMAANVLLSPKLKPVRRPPQMTRQPKHTRSLDSLSQLVNATS